ncbi:MAG: recombinase RecA [Halanaerobiales bacterium]|nr:recombinase RecA [Halanaerobiales bacterium]
MNENSKERLEVLKAAINKQFGKGTVLTLNQKPTPERDNVIDTGSIALNQALGIGGYPKGRIIEVYGGEGAGKSSLCLHAIANCQKQGGVCAFVDAEQTLDLLYSESLEVDTNNLLLSQPDYGEQALQIVDMMVRSHEVDLIIVDSIAALIPKAELDGDMEQQFVGTQARMMGKALRKLAPGTRESSCTVIFVNQIRQKVGVIWGSNETTPGGLALKYYASQRLDIRRTGDLKEGDEIVGQKTRVRIVKNKLAPPKRIAEFDLIFGKGIDSLAETLDFAVIDGLMQKSASWYKYNEENIAQGKPAAKLWLKENPEIATELRNKILESRGLI